MKGHNNLLKKVILLFLILLTPPLIISIISLHRNNIQQKEQLISAIETDTNTHAALLDRELEQIYSANLHILEQNLIGKLNASYPYLSVYERSTLLNTIRDQLYSICSNSPFLSSAHLHLFNYNLVYSSTSFEYGSYHTLDAADNTLYQDLSSQRGLLQYYWDPFTNQMELSVFMTPSFQNAPYAVNMVLSQSNLKKYMQSHSSYERELYLLNMENGFSLTNIPTACSQDAMTFLSGHSAVETAGHQEITLNEETYIAFYAYVPYSNGTYLRFIPMTSLVSSIHYNYRLMLLFYLLIITTCILFFAGINLMIHKPLHTLTAALEEVENGNFDIQLEYTGNNDFSYLFQAFNHMSSQLVYLIERDYNQKILLQKAELKQLQAQINPHFLYNSFFMLQRMIKFDPDGAQEMSVALASFFRYITKNSMDNTTLGDEYEHVKNYTYIQGLRFEGRIRIELDPLPERFRYMPVPKLILQPILENIFKYGLSNTITDGLIRVSFDTCQDSITIRIEDNGKELLEETLLHLQKQLFSSLSSSSGVEMSGILNIQRRLHIFSNYKDSLHVSRSVLGGMCVEIILKLEQETNK